MRWAALALAMMTTAAGIAFGAVRDEEAQARLEAVARKVAQRAAEERPLPPASPATVPAVTKALRLKPGAPEPVRVWFNSLAKTRSRMAAVLMERAQAAKSDAESLRKRAADIRRRPAPMRVASVTSFGRSYTVDQATVEAWGHERRDLESQAKEKDREAAEWEAKAQSVEADASRIDFGPLTVMPGGFGVVASVRVLSVASPTDVVGMYDGETVWVHGIDARNVVDDQALVLNTTFIVNGTRHYSAVSGASKTVRMIEPFDPKPYLEVVEVDPLHPLPPAAAPAAVRPAAAGADVEPIRKGMTLAEIQQAAGGVAPQVQSRDGDGNSTYNLVVTTGEGRKQYVLRLRDGVLTGFNMTIVAPPPSQTVRNR